LILEVSNATKVQIVVFCVVMLCSGMETRRRSPLMCRQLTTSLHGVTTQKIATYK